MNIAFPDREFLLGKNNNAAAFRRFVSQRRQLRGIGQFFFGGLADRYKSRGLTVAQGNRAGFVQQQHIDIARRFNGPARGGDDVFLHHPADTGNADSGQQTADSRRNQADQQRHQHGDRNRRTGFGDFHAVQGKRQQGHGGQQKNQRQCHQQNSQGDFIRRFLPRCAFHHRNHAIQEGFAGIDHDPHHQPVGQYPRTAGYRTEIAARFADDRRAFAGDRAFIDTGRAFDDFAVGGNKIARFNQHDVAAP